MKTQCKR